MNRRKAGSVERCHSREIKTEKAPIDPAKQDWSLLIIFKMPECRAIDVERSTSRLQFPGSANKLPCERDCFGAQVSGIKRKISSEWTTNLRFLPRAEFRTNPRLRQLRHCSYRERSIFRGSTGRHPPCMRDATGGFHRLYCIRRWLELQSCSACGERVCGAWNAAILDLA